MDLAREKKFGRMVSLNGSEIVDVPLPDLNQQKRVLSEELYRDAETFFG